MKMYPDPEADDALLDALLRDDDWRAASADFKAGAVRTLRRRRRVRWLVRSAGGAAALAAVLALVAHWPARPVPATRPLTIARAEAPQPQRQASRRLTDAQLLAAFPRGTCFIAEVDGKKELVFLDPRVERAYLGRVGARAQ